MKLFLYSKFIFFIVFFQIPKIFSKKIKLTIKNEKDKYHPFELYNDFSSLNNNDTKVTSFITESLNNIKEILKKILIVKNKYKISSDLDITEVCNKNIYNYSNNIKSGIDADFILFPFFSDIKKLIFSKYCIKHKKTNRPIIGYLEINYKKLKEKITKNEISINKFELKILHYLFVSIGFLYENKDLKNYDSLIVGVDMKLSNVKTLIVQNKYLNEIIPYGKILFEKKIPNWEIKYLKQLNDIMINNPKKRLIISELSLQYLEDSGWFKKNLDYCEFNNELENLYSKLPYEIYINKENPYCYLNDIEKKICKKPNIFKNIKFHKFNKNFNANVNLNYLYNKPIPYFQSVKKYNFQELTLLSNNNPKYPVKCNHKYIYFKYEDEMSEREEIKNYKKEKILIKDKNYFVIRSHNNIYQEMYATKIILNENNIINDKSFYQPNIKYKLFRSFYTAQVNYINLAKYERYNHFPNEYLLTFKDYLVISYNKMKKKFGAHFDFLPESYTLIEDKKFLKKKFNSNYKLKKGDLWLLKPTVSGGGVGIRFIKNYKDIKKNDVISKYIENPYLLYGKKFHIRLYIVVTGYKPLKIYFYEEGQVMRSAFNYSFDYENFKFKKGEYLTNGHQNFGVKSYNKNISFDSEEGSEWSLKTLRNYFEKRGINFNEKIMSQIYDLSIKSILLTASEEIKALDGLTHLHSNNIFEFYGIDVMFDDNLKVYLLEFNRVASTMLYNIINKVNKKKIFVDIYNLIGVYPFSHDGKDLLYIEEENKCKFDNKVNEAIDESLEEFNRPQGGFKRLFPDLNNLDYYKQFFENPGEINIKFWEILKKYN